MNTESSNLPSGFRLGYRRSLDGLRGVAILMVIGTHEMVINTTFGVVGVEIFFVLSGFLITSLLLQEWHHSQRIDLRNFYLRRALRLLPALLLLLIVFLIRGALVDKPRDFHFDLKEAFGALLYSSNWIWAYELTRIDLLRHTWSLSIEEQFYLLWPVCLILGLKTIRGKSLFNYVLLGAFLSWCVRFFLFHGTAADIDRLYAGTDTRADSLLLGCAVAIGLFYDLFPRASSFQKTLSHGSFIAIVGLLLICVSCEYDAPLMIEFGWSAVAILSGILILALMRNTSPVIERVLSGTWLVGIGKISYGLYLWHWPLCRIMSFIFVPRWKIVISSILAFVPLALISYYCVERPCLRFKNRIASDR